MDLEPDNPLKALAAVAAIIALAMQLGLAGPAAGRDADVRPVEASRTSGGGGTESPRQ